jgi:kynurenine 3-monooxygenase
MTTPRGVLEIEPDLLIAADGAGSVVRRALAAAGAVTASEDLLDHGYKEILVPAAADGDFALDPKGLHIWPRGGFMLIALPNPDCTFTATLFLPHRGAHGFDTITAATVREFFAAQFPDALPLMPELGAQFAARPVGVLGTIHCRPWQTVTSAPGHRQVLLIGDAAHAIVPFHGQGMNAAFEDCAELDRLLAASSHDWAAVLREFEAQRRPNAEAIARMALENYTEMRDGVRDPRFAQRADIAFALERQFPGRFIPRYSMVMFHPEIAYAEAERRGRIQAELLDQAMQQDDNTRALARAAELVAERL